MLYPSPTEPWPGCHPQAPADQPAQHGQKGVLVVDDGCVCSHTRTWTELSLGVWDAPSLLAQGCAGQGVSTRGSGSLSISCWAGRGARPRWGEVVSLAVQGRGVPLSWGSTRFPLPLPAHLPICSGSLSGLPHTQTWGSGRFWNGILKGI